ncbi:MAG: hypothetical protein F4077_04955 [Gammaproteobacteria bacterium]|nr:hypothetical protein [Gammaproteobacteria bacterium]MYI77097.1 hypothetical protein [Gammaproteobacteria bacterium]
MRFIQILIVSVVLLAIILAIVFLQKQNKPKNKDANQQSEARVDIPAKRTAKIFIGVIGISIVALCTTVVVFHFVD